MKQYKNRPFNSQYLSFLPSINLPLILKSSGFSNGSVIIFAITGVGSSPFLCTYSKSFVFNGVFISVSGSKSAGDAVFDNDEILRGSCVSGSFESSTLARVAKWKKEIKKF